MMSHPICITCGVQHSDTEAGCKICDDERQYVGWEGQQWQTLTGMRHDGYRNRIEEIEPGLIGMSTEPKFAIGHRSLVVRTNNGNILWDPISYIDDATVEVLSELGGIQAISASHPHFYGALVEWSHAFDSAPIFLPEADREWLCRDDPSYVFYADKALPVAGTTLIRCGGHFDGSAVLYWPDGAGGRGVLLTGDTIQVVLDRRLASFMRSYPNLIPLDPDAIRGILAAIEPCSYDRIYGGWWGRSIVENAQEAVSASAERYLRWSGAITP